MKLPYLLPFLLLSGCNMPDDAQVESRIEAAPKKGPNIKNHKFARVEDGMLVELYGYDLSVFQPLEMDNLEMPLNDLKVEHVLVLAVQACDVDFSRKLLEAGANPDFKIEGNDLITDVAYCDDRAVELTKLFLAHGANVNGADQDNDSFLSYAISSDNLVLVELILQNGGDLKQVDTNLGCEPVFSVKSDAMFFMLEKQGIDPHVRCTNKGRSLLHIAARRNLIETAKWLLSKQVDVSVVDASGETAFDYATKAGNQEIAGLLQ